MKSCGKTSYCLVNKGPGSDQLPFHTIQIEKNDNFFIQNWYKNRIQSKLFQDQKNPPDLWDLQIYRFEEKKHIKVAVFPCSLILWPKPCFCYLMRKFAFLWRKIIIHKQQCTRMCRGVACKPGRQESVISKASLHADHPPMCLKLLCKCTII